MCGQRTCTSGSRCWRWSFDTREIGPIGPRSVYEEDLLLTIPPEAAWNDRARQLMVVTLLTGAGATDSTLIHSDWYALHNGPILTVYPDYRGCGAVPLVVGEFVAAPLVCTEPSNIYFFELTARTDRGYGIEQGGPPELWGASVYSADGAYLGDVYPGDRIVFYEAGTYFIVDFFPFLNPPPVRFMRLIEEPLPSTSDARRIR